MGQLRDRMEADLRLTGYSASTRKIYLCYARLFAKHFMRSPAEMGEAEERGLLIRRAMRRGLLVNPVLFFVRHASTTRRLARRPRLVDGTRARAVACLLYTSDAADE